MNFGYQDQEINALPFSFIVEDEYYAVRNPGGGCIPPHEKCQIWSPVVGD